MTKKRDTAKILQKKAEFIKRISQILNVSEDKVFDLFSHKKSSLRINTLKAEKNAVMKTIPQEVKLEHISWYNSAYIINEGKDILTAAIEFEKGLYYIQNASSLISPLVLEPKPGELILDACAAPGGKTVHIAALTNNRAVITANDASHQRMAQLKKLCNSYGAHINTFISQPAQFLNKHLTQQFDKILVDAPCSGEGLINLQNPDTLKFWSTKKIKRLSKLQKQIMQEMYKMLKPGGTLLYSTCTLAPEENEEVIDFILRKNPDIKLLDVNLPIENQKQGLGKWRNKEYLPEITKCMRIVPNEYMQSFFICKLTKK